MLHNLSPAAFGDAGHGQRLMRTTAERHGRMMLVAMPPSRLPPFSFGNSRLHRLRIVIVHQGEVPDVPPSSVIGELPQLETNATTSPHSHPLRHPRRLQGEILCDGAGRLYEKIGDFVRPIHQLVVGPGGEVLDLAPPRTLRPRGREPVIDLEASPAIDDRASSPAHAHRHESTDERKDEARPHIAGWCELASTPERVVQFGEFKGVLTPQLRHPERLRDAHRLSCRVHIYESGRAQRIEALAAEIAGGAMGQLFLLTAALAERLGLVDLAPWRHAPAAGNRELGLVLPGERVIRLEVLNDPTAATAPPPAAAGQTSGHEPSAPRMAPSELGHHARSKSIPERFLVPWEFALSREEAIYDLNVAATRPGLRSLLVRLLGVAMNRRQLRKWQALLRGKSLDDQLWGVRPPPGGLSNPVIRDWARRMLEAAGYDPATMLFEWEIYWRRKRG